MRSSRSTSRARRHSIEACSGKRRRHSASNFGRSLALASSNSQMNWKQTAASLLFMPS